MRATAKDATAMRRALAESGAAEKSADVPVGAVVLGLDGEVLGTGHNERELRHDPTAHAEIVALRAAATRLGTWRLDGCTLVVTLEPCVMCAGAVLQSRIARLVFGAWDKKAGGAGSVVDVVRERRLPHRVEVVAGVLAAEAEAQLATFFAKRR